MDYLIYIFWLIPMFAWIFIFTVFDGDDDGNLIVNVSFNYIQKLGLKTYDDAVPFIFGVFIPIYNFALVGIFIGVVIKDKSRDFLSTEFKRRD